MTTSPTSLDPAILRRAADRLGAAYAARTPCEPIRDLIAETDLASAYAVQSELTKDKLAAGATIIGRKIGLTSEAVQNQLGVNTPDFGVLFDDMWINESDLVPYDRLLQPKAEAEVAFVLGEDLDGDLSEGPETTARIRRSIAGVMAALEIVDSRVANWNIKFADTVADNASSGLFVLSDQRFTLDEVEPLDVVMSMSIDGEVVSTGNGAACLGDPLNALTWLARTAAEYGEPLRAGQIILSGALGPMVSVEPGATVTAELTGLGTVTANFSGKAQQ